MYTRNEHVRVDGIVGHVDPGVTAGYGFAFVGGEKNENPFGFKFQSQFLLCNSFMKVPQYNCDTFIKTQLANINVQPPTFSLYNTWTRPFAAPVHSKLSQNSYIRGALNLTKSVIKSVSNKAD